MAQIRMTPDELRSAAQTLETNKGEILSAVQTIASTVDATTANWEGAAQSSFVANFDEMLPMLQETFPQIIEGLAKMMNGAADAIEQADQEIAKAFG